MFVFLSERDLMWRHIQKFLKGPTVLKFVGHRGAVAMMQVLHPFTAPHIRKHMNMGSRTCMSDTSTQSYATCRAHPDTNVEAASLIYWKVTQEWDVTVMGWRTHH